MGLLRFILAFSVVFAHSQPFLGLTCVETSIAVESFYIISGFYMALILNEKYVGPGSYRLFITNRLLRLLPAYWAVLLLMVVISFGLLVFFNQGMIRLYQKFAGMMAPESLVFILFSNIAIIGSDVLSFLKLSGVDGSLVITTAFNHTDPPFPPVFLFLFIPQIWSVGVELEFYMIAPLLVRRKAAAIAALIVLSLVLRAYIFNAGFERDPWTYRFFPVQLVFFLAGVISYKLYVKLKSSAVLNKAAIVICLSMLLFTVLYQFIPNVVIRWFDLKQIFYYAAVIVSIPAMFVYTAKNKVDKYLGDLAYPIYISHMAVFYGTTYYYAGRYKEPLYYVSIVLVLALSMLLIRFVANPIENFRQGRVKSLSAPEAVLKASS